MKYYLDERDDGRAAVARDQKEARRLVVSSICPRTRVTLALRHAERCNGLM